MNPASRYLAAVAAHGNADADMVKVTRAQRARYQRIEKAAQAIVDIWFDNESFVVDLGEAMDDLGKAFTD